MAAARAARAPIRGESGFAKYAREHGGDPRLEEARERRHRRQQAAEVLAGEARAIQAEQAAERRAAARGSSGSSGASPAASGRQRPATRQRRAVFEPATRPLLSTGGVSVNDASGFVLGALAWVLVLQYLNAGPAGVRNWLRAKFLNKGANGEALP